MSIKLTFRANGEFLRSDEGLTLETSVRNVNVILITVANLHFQLS